MYSLQYVLYSQVQCIITIGALDGIRPKQFYPGCADYNFKVRKIALAFVLVGSILFLLALMLYKALVSYL